MKPLADRYEVTLSGGPAGYAALSAPGVSELKSAPPLDRPGDAWSPGDLLLAALASCFFFTLRAVAKASKVDFVSLDVLAEATVDRQDGVTRFTEIVLRPKLTLPPGADRGHALDILERSEKSCLVSASLSTPMRLEPELVAG